VVTDDWQIHETVYTTGLYQLPKSRIMIALELVLVVTSEMQNY